MISKSKSIIFMLTVAAVLSSGIWSGTFCGSFEGKIIQKSTTIPVAMGSGMEGAQNEEQAAEKYFAKSEQELIQEARQEGLLTGSEDAFEENSSEIYLKGDMMRVDEQSADGKMSMIYNISDGTVVTLNWDAKTAVTMSADEMGNQMKNVFGDNLEEDEMAAGPDEDSDLFSMKPTGVSKTINGFSCKLFKGTDTDGSYTHLWLTTDSPELFGAFQQIYNKMSGMLNQKDETDNEKAFYEKYKGVSILTKNFSDGLIQIDEIKEIKPQNISSDVFAIPAGFKKVSMQEMMQQQLQQYQNSFPDTNE